jgi:hypothetical protein
MDPCLKSTPVPVSNSEMGWAEPSTGIAPTITNSCARPRSAASTASTPISPDIDERIEARLAPVKWTTILDTRVLIAEDLGAARTPLVLVQVQC